jgi:hypothetical protein
MNTAQFREKRMDHDDLHHGAEPKPFWKSRFAVGFLVLGAIAAYFLLNGHRAHFFGALPYLLLLACPLMHVFMHHGHGSHTGSPPRPSAGEQGSDVPTTSQLSKTVEQP